MKKAIFGFVIFVFISNNAFALTPITTTTQTSTMPTATGTDTGAVTTNKTNTAVLVDSTSGAGVVVNSTSTPITQPASATTTSSTTATGSQFFNVSPPDDGQVMPKFTVVTNADGSTTTTYVPGWAPPSLTQRPKVLNIDNKTDPQSTWITYVGGSFEYISLQTGIKVWQPGDGTVVTTYPNGTVTVWAPKK